MNLIKTYLGLTGCLLAAVASAEDTQRKISVIGTAEIRVVPDEVSLQFGIQSRSEAIDEALAQNEQRAKEVLKFLSDSGVEAKDIQTDYLRVTPRYDANSENRQSDPFGGRRVDEQISTRFFVVQRDFGLRIRKIADFERILAGLLRSGANEVSGVEFRTTEMRQHRDRARDLAIVAAKEKASAMAKSLGVSFGKAISISEIGGGGWGMTSRSHFLSNVAVQNAFEDSVPSDNSDGTLAAGTIHITASVQVAFELD